MSNIAQLLSSQLEHQPILTAARQLADESSLQVYLVGGYVRDLLMQRSSRDIDLMVEGDGIAFAEGLARQLKLGPVVPYADFGTALIAGGETRIEVATARSEIYSSDSRKPEVKPASLLSDLSRRDFTINALAVSLSGEEYGRLSDPYGGLRDMQAGILKTPLDPDVTFSDDPLRMLRAARFAAQLDFSIDPAIRASMERQAGRMEIVSWERVTEEIMKLLSADRPSIGFYILKETGLLREVFPELDVMSGVEWINGQGHKDVFVHTLQVVDNAAALSPRPQLRFAALVHDIAKPETKQFDRSRGWTFHHHEEVGRKMLRAVAKRMRLSSDLRDYLMKMTKLHLRPIALAKEGITDSALRRLMHEAGEEIDDLMMLCRADVTTKRESRAARYMQNFERVEELMADVTLRDEMQAFQSPVRGAEIMAVCNITEGRRVGVLKKAIEEAILDGHIENSHAAALAYLHEIKDKADG